MKLFIVEEYGAHDTSLMVVVANDMSHAFNLWKAYYADWDKPDRVKVFELPAPYLASIIPWQNLKPVEFKVYQ